MRQSQLFTKTIKNVPKDETSFNAQTLIRAGFIDKVSAGVYTYLPMGLKVLNKINDVIRSEMNAIGGQEILMPALVPKDLWDTTERWNKIDVLFKLIGADKKEYALGATHEEVVTPLAKKYIFSYKELPISIYQIQTKFRNELRAKAGLIRGREFLMKDLYSFHTDQDDLDKYYLKAQDAYNKVYKRCGLGERTYLTYASGGVFSKYSHEYQTLTEVGEDSIYICDGCHIAINREIIEDQKHRCPICGNDNLREEKAVEVGNIFKLGNRFSSSFGFQYTDNDGKNNDVIMGCYGIGPSRILGTIVEVCHDDRGIIWPEEIAPFKVHLIRLKSKEKEVNEAADNVYNKLLDNNIEVLYDDRDEIGAGEKFADSDLIGCPYRIVISEKTLKENSAELKKRSSDNIELIALDDVIKRL